MVKLDQPTSAWNLLSHKMIYWVHYEHALMKYLLYIFCDALNSV